jgi:outer membrane murein-binding lipoprotein Lpp
MFSNNQTRSKETSTMSKTLILLAISTSLLLAGCQSSGPVVSNVAPVATPVAEVAKPALSEEASKSLAQAEADIKAAKSRAALWTTAEEALKKAQEMVAEEMKKLTGGINIPGLM